MGKIFKRTSLSLLTAAGAVIAGNLISAEIEDTRLRGQMYALIPQNLDLASRDSITLMQGDEPTQFKITKNEVTPTLYGNKRYVAIERNDWYIKRYVKIYFTTQPNT
jgi:hypothetical protein